MRKCCVIGCSNHKKRNDCRDKTFFRLPIKNPQLLELWLKNIGRQNFTPSDNSVICSDHFQESTFTICPFTKRRNLNQDAVPTIFKKTPKVTANISLLSIALTKGGTRPVLPGAVRTFPSLTSSEPSKVRGNPDGKGKIKEVKSLQAGTVILQSQDKKEDREQISTIQKSQEKLNSPKPKYLTIISNKNVLLLPLHFNQPSTAISENEPQNVAEPSTVIKQEPVECAEEQPQPVIEKIHGTKEITSSIDIKQEPGECTEESPLPVIERIHGRKEITSSTSTIIKQEPDGCVDEPPLPVIEKVHGANEITPSCSSSTFSISSAVFGKSSSNCSAPFLTNALSFPDCNTTNMDKTSAADIPNKTAQKRKINDSEPNSIPVTTSEVELCQLTKPPKPNPICILRPTHIPQPLGTKPQPTHTATTSKQLAGPTPNATQAKWCRRSKPSMPSERDSKPKPQARAETTKKSEGSFSLPIHHSDMVKSSISRPNTSSGSSNQNRHKLILPAETTKKYEGPPTLPIKNDENAFREMFKCLLDIADDNNGPRTAESSGDLFDVFAYFIAGKLREMDWNNCAYVLKGIMDLVFKAGKGQHHSEVKSDIFRPNTSSGSSNQQ